MTGAAAARQQALKLEARCKDSGYTGYWDQCERDPDFRQDQEKLGRDRDFAQLILQEIPHGTSGANRKMLRLSPQVAAYIYERDAVVGQKRKRQLARERERIAEAQSRQSTSWSSS